jgi:hypothetical protein
MADEKPVTVGLAPNAVIADAAILLLRDAGIEAEAMAPEMHEESQPITGETELQWQRNALEIRVLDATKVEAARELLSSAATQATFQAMAQRRAQREGTVTAECEDCGKTSEWPASSMGRTETCPHCAGYMDIPDPDDQWGDVDFGDPEGENEGDEEN